MVRAVSSMSARWGGSLFGLGMDDRGISTIDAGGVALASIQALSKELRNTKKEIVFLNSGLLKKKNEELVAKIAEVENQQARIQQFEKLVGALVAKEKAALVTGN